MSSWKGSMWSRRRLWTMAPCCSACRTARSLPSIRRRPPKPPSRFIPPASKAPAGFSAGAFFSPAAGSICPCLRIDDRPFCRPPFFPADGLFLPSPAFPEPLYAFFGRRSRFCHIDSQIIHTRPLDRTGMEWYIMFSTQGYRVLRPRHHDKGALAKLSFPNANSKFSKRSLPNISARLNRSAPRRLPPCPSSPSPPPPSATR